MKVKCISNKINGKTYDMVSINREYIVLAIEFYNSEESLFIKSIGDYILYRLEDNYGTILPLPSKLFIILNGNLPKHWISYNNESCYSILHKEWANLYFWDDFYNDEPNAVATFKKVKAQIYEEEINLNSKD